MGQYPTIKERTQSKYPALNPDVVLLILYRELGTYMKVAEQIGATESGVWRRIHELELQALANGNGFGKK